jgi:predicted membrane-bound mannosyltransferase
LLVCFKILDIFLLTALSRLRLLRWLLWLRREDLAVALRLFIGFGVLILGIRTFLLPIQLIINAVMWSYKLFLLILLLTIVIDTWLHSIQFLGLRTLFVGFLRALSGYCRSDSRLLVAAGIAFVWLGFFGSVKMMNELIILSLASLSSGLHDFFMLKVVLFFEIWLTEVHNAHRTLNNNVESVPIVSLMENEIIFLEVFVLKASTNIDIGDELIQIFLISCLWVLL